jgi:5-methylcytosine-specific restriction protein A
MIEIPVPLAPARPCAQPGCPELVRSGRRCPTHARAYERGRGSAARRGYGVAWQHIRAAYLAAHPTCECSPDCTEAATDVDHRDGSGPFGDNRWSNLQAMSHGHHSAKTSKRDGGFGRPRRREG